jgi:hypothetical protein
MILFLSSALVVAVLVSGSGALSYGWTKAIGMPEASGHGSGHGISDLDSAYSLMVRTSWMSCKVDTDCLVASAPCGGKFPASKQYLAEIEKAASDKYRGEGYCTLVGWQPHYTIVSVCRSEACVLDKIPHAN